MLHTADGESPITIQYLTNQSLVFFELTNRSLVFIELTYQSSLSMFQVVDSAEDKWSFLRTMSRHVCNTLCRPDPDQLLVRLSARDMSLDASDLNVSSFSR